MTLREEVLNLVKEEMSLGLGKYKILDFLDNKKFKDCTIQIVEVNNTNAKKIIKSYKYYDIYVSHNKEDEPYKNEKNFLCEFSTPSKKSKNEALYNCYKCIVQNFGNYKISHNTVEEIRDYVASRFGNEDWYKEI